MRWEDLPPEEREVLGIDCPELIAKYTLDTVSIVTATPPHAPPPLTR